MRLIDALSLKLEEFDEDEVPQYAILSHTWEDGEVSYAEMKHYDTSVRKKKGFAKIAMAAEMAGRDDLHWVWVDTCCIDKSSSAELQEAINSMWRWYQNAKVCYVFLTDLPENMPSISDVNLRRHLRGQPSLPTTMSEYPKMYKEFAGARWFSRGWCLQELIAPKRLLFYSFRPQVMRCYLVGERSKLSWTISVATRIDPAVLEHKVPLSSMSVAQRMSWAAGRKTRRLEDQAYSLLGIFDVSMPMLYGEGKRSFIRLQEEIIRNNSDHSIFAWGRNGASSGGSLLATSPDDFADASDVVQWGQPTPFDLTNRGLRITLPVLSNEATRQGESVAVLNCRYRTNFSNTIALRLASGPSTEMSVAVLDLYKGFLHPENPLSQRLALVHARHLEAAVPSELLISRKFVPRPASVRIMFYAEFVGTDPDHQYFEETVTEQDTVKPRGHVFLTTHAPITRAGIMVMFPSARRFSLVFGFDRVRLSSDDRDGTLLPGVWAKFHRGPQRLRDIIRFEPIHEHGRLNNCADPDGKICSHMPTSARVSLEPEGHLLEATISHERVFDEDILTVRLKIVQLHELEAEMPAGDTCRGVDEYEINRVTNEGALYAAMDMHSPFTPDIRDGIFADPKSSSKRRDADSMRSLNSTSPNQPSRDQLKMSNGSTLEAASLISREPALPFHDEVQSMPTFPGSEVRPELQPQREHRDTFVIQCKEGDVRKEWSTLQRNKRQKRDVPEPFYPMVQPGPIEDHPKVDTSG